jgi:ubiquinone/menaquinone biosynthesis C-methylase UbiE
VNKILWVYHMAEINDSNLENKIGDIRRFWDEKARIFKTDPTATLGDSLLRDIEVREIIKFVDDGQTVLDCGSGNGTSTLQIARRRAVNLIGVDYSEAMLEMAEINLEEVKSLLRGHVRFEKGDVLNLTYKEGSFDTVITMRCLQNLPSFDLQKQAILSIKGLLKTGGRFLMLECSNDGLRKLNEMRRWVGRELLSPPWHNLFFDDCDLCRLSEEHSFPLMKTINVSGVYQLLALCIQHRLRWLARILPCFLDTGYHKLYIWQKE